MKRIGLCLAMLAPMAVSGQDVITMRGPALCTSCTVSLEPLASLGAHEGPGSFSRGPRAIARDSRGRTYVVDCQEQASVFVFDERGVFLKRIGREGQGPGEFRRIAAMVVGPGDSLHVFDVGNQRRNVIGPDAQWARSDNWKLQLTAAQVIGPTTLAVNGLDPTEPTSPKLVQIHRFDGSRVAALGFDPRFDVTDIRLLAQPAYRTRVLGASAEGLWTGRRNRYQIEEWAPSGELRRSAVRTVDFFPEGLEWDLPTPDRPPQPILTGIQSRDANTVWVVSRVAAAGWRSGIGKPIEQNGQTYYEADDDVLYDSVLELWDLSQARVILSQRVPENVFGFLGPDLVWSTRRDVLGIPYIDVWRLDLRGLTGDRRFP